MTFIADLHIHSKYSRATAKNLDLENLYVEARKKGITVLATGDCTHPVWFAELKEKLVPAEDGLFRLTDEIESRLEKSLKPSCKGEVRFILSSEISSIYKKNDRTRKNHNLVYFADFDSAERFNHKLAAIGNIASDGRPILGLDARNLLEILLETDDQAFMVPAHIWTPWFSLLGSRSGFDTVDECFGDLSSEIFAVETGLSSDPPMNHRVSFLDRFTLISNSDAHSPAKLGREANIFGTGLSFSEMKHALKNKGSGGFLGTLEFFPEEGKYHHDGHRKCQVNMSPEQSVRAKGLCPQCGNPLTLGVNYRVLQLADRPEGEKPAVHHPFRSIIPFDEVLAEITGCGTQSKRVKELRETALTKLGPELSILTDMAIADIETAKIPLLAEAIQRIRNHSLHIQPGYDGDFGVIKIFTDDEKEELLGQSMMFSFLDPDLAKEGYVKAGTIKGRGMVPQAERKETENRPPGSGALNPLQEQAVTHPNGPLLIVAGPGTGKTHTLTRRIAHLILKKQVQPEHILAITFTSRAAGEMKERLRKHLPGKKTLPIAATIHSFCQSLLRGIPGEAALFNLVDDNVKADLIRNALEKNGEKAVKSLVKKASEIIERAKQNLLGPFDDLTELCRKPGINAQRLSEVYSAYQTNLAAEKLMDFDDLIFATVGHLESDKAFQKDVRARFPYVFVDEYQDLNHGQYRLIRALAPDGSNICVIGDPDQAIYGFRGSDSGYFNRFKSDYPTATVVRLTRNYRSAENILAAAGQMIEAGPCGSGFVRSKLWSGIEDRASITVLENPTEKSEAVAIGKRIEQMMGGTGFHSLDFQTKTMLGDETLSFADFAILTRTASQGRLICEMLEKGGIACRHVNRDHFLSTPPVAALLAMLKKVCGLPCASVDARVVQSFCKTQDESPEDLEQHLKKLAGLAVTIQIEKSLILVPELAKAFENKKRRDTLKQVLSMAKPFGHDTADFLKTLYMSSDQDLYDLKAETVTVMTMHAAKGLEFKVVFVAGCETGMIPYARNGEPCDNMDEERRLFFVAMTRARDFLFLSFSKARTRFGKTNPSDLSPFVADVDRKLLRFEVSGFSTLEKQKKPVQLTLF
jgi:uncharacterized protein (TIGR00375 family)